VELWLLHSLHKFPLLWMDVNVIPCQCSFRFLSDLVLILLIRGFYLPRKVVKFLIGLKVLLWVVNE